MKKAACFFPRRLIKHGRRTPVRIKAALPITTVTGKSKIGISPGAMSPASAYSGHRVHEAAAILQEEMEGCVNYAVPLSTEVHQGKNWLEAH